MTRSAHHSSRSSATQTGRRDDGLQARAQSRPDGDLEAAARSCCASAGMAQAAKRAGRETTEGARRLPARERHAGTMVAVGCETEPVSKNEEFHAFAEKVLEAVDADGAERRRALERSGASSSPSSARTSSSSAPRASRPGDGEIARAYVHPPANKLGVLVQLARRERRARAAARDAHLVRRARVDEPRGRPEAVVAAEREIYSNSDEVRRSPSRRARRSSRACSNKRFFAAAGVLTEQPWIHDSAKTVGQALDEAGAEVLEFERFSLAG